MVAADACVWCIDIGAGRGFDERSSALADRDSLVELDRLSFEYSVGGGLSSVAEAGTAGALTFSKVFPPPGCAEYGFLSRSIGCGVGVSSESDTTAAPDAALEND